MLLISTEAEKMKQIIRPETLRCPKYYFSRQLDRLKSLDYINKRYSQQPSITEQSTPYPYLC